MTTLTKAHADHELKPLKEDLKDNAELDLPPSKDDLKKFLHDNGIEFLEEDLRKNKITTKELFFTLRKDEKTFKNIIDGKNKAQVELIRKKVFMGKTYEAKQAKFNDAKEFYSELIAEATQIKDEISTLNKEELTEQDEKVKKGIEDIRIKITTRHNNFTFPDLGSQTKKLKEQMAMIISDITQYSSSLMRTEELSDNELVRHFSVNRGMLLKKDGCIQTKAPVFQFYDAEICYDNAKPSEISSIFFTKKSSMERRGILVEKGGYSFGMNATISAAGMAGPVLGAFSVSAGIHSTNAYESIGSSNTAKTSSVIYSLQVDSYPMGVLRVERNKIHLNENIISRLESIKEIESKEKMREELWNFMEIYGSHVCPEVILGGIYMDTSTATFKGQYTLQEKESLVSDAYTRSISAGGLIIGQAGVGKVGVDLRDDKQSQRGEQKRGAFNDEEVNISYKRKIHGGDNLAPKPMWKESLLYNSNYAVIDRSFDQIIAIWELLPKELNSLTKEFKMTYLNKVFNSKGTWIDSYEKILDKQRNEYYEENKDAMIEQILNVVKEKDCLQKFPSGPYTSDEKVQHLSLQIKPFITENIFSQLVADNWNINETVRKLSNAAIQYFEEQQENEWKKEHVVFFEIEAEKETDRHSDNLIEFTIVDHWQKYDSRFNEKKWPSGTRVTHVHDKKGYLEFCDTGFSYSNNRKINTSGPKKAFFYLKWKATRRALKEAGFTWDEIMKPEPMFRYETVPDI